MVSGPRPRLPRHVMSVALVAVLLAQGAELAHAGLARHVRCAEHGELVEASELPASGVAETAVAFDSLDASSTALAALGAEHQHCVLPSFRQGRLPLVASTGLWPCVFSHVEPLPLALGGDLPRSLACLSAAPKHSPPV